MSPVTKRFKQGITACRATHRELALAYVLGGTIHMRVAGRSENQYQRLIRRVVQGVFAATMHPRTAVQVIVQVCCPSFMCTLYV